MSEAVVQVLWPGPVTRDLQVVVEHNVGHHGFHNVGSEEATRASSTTINLVLLLQPTKELDDVPGALAMPESDELGGGLDELVFQLLALLLAHAGKAEGIEGLRVREVFLVEVRRELGANDHRALGDEGAVDERDVLNCLADHCR